MADTIKVTLTPATIEVRPGAPTEAVITIHNAGPTVEEYGLALDGLPAAWYTLPDTRIALFPNDHDQVRLTMLPAQGTGMGAGEHPFTVTVVARANPAEKTIVSGMVRVAAAVALDAQLRPSRATGRKARYNVLLRNGGNAPVDVDLDVCDSEDGCDFTVTPLTVQLGPGQRATMSIQARPLRTRLVGPDHSFDFRVTVQPSPGEPRPLQGLFIYRPRFRRWRPFVRLVALAVVAGLLVVVAPLIIPRLRQAAQVLTSSPVYAQANVSMGRVKIGARNPDKVAAALGKDATMTNHDTVVTVPQRVGTLKARFRHGQVVSLETNSPAVMLAGGVHVGSSVAAVRRAFGASLAVVGGAMALKARGAGGGSAATARPSAGSATSVTPGAAGTATVTPAPGGAPATSAATTSATPAATPGAMATITATVLTATATTPLATGTITATVPLSGAMVTNPLAGGAFVLVGKTTLNGQHPRTYFDLNKAGTRVVSIRMGVYPWLTPDHGGPTTVGAMTATTTWTLDGAPYLIGSHVRIPRGVTLTIKPGVHVYFTAPNSSLYVDGGTLQAVGTADAPVVFTGLDDQQHGAYDTLDRPAPQRGSWGGIGVTSTGGTLDLNHAEVYYGASTLYSGNPEVYVDGSANPTVSIQNSTIEAAAGYGLDAGAAPAGTVIQGNAFNADNYPLLINGGLSLDDSNLFAPKGEVFNTHNAVYVRPGATIAAGGATVRWTQRKAPFILQGNEMVGPDGTLEIGSDVILKGRDQESGLTVAGGRLIINGQRTAPVLLTSYADDTKGGDSNGDGKESRPRPGDWRGAVVVAAGYASLHRVKIWWAGSNGRPALSIGDNATVTMGRSEVAESAGDGIANTSDHPLTISTTLIHDNAGYGISFSRHSPDARRTTRVSGLRMARNARGNFGDTTGSSATPVPGVAPTSAASTLTPTTGATGTASPPSAAGTASPTATTRTIATATIMPAATGTATTAATGTAIPGATATTADTAMPTPTATSTVAATATASAVATRTATASATRTATAATTDIPTAGPTDTTPNAAQTPAPASTSTGGTP